MYSTLAAGLQLPVALWLFDRIGLPLAGSDIRITVVTGLDALSRNGDLENFRLAMADMASITALPPDLIARLKMQEIASFVGQGRGVDLAKFIISDEEYAQKQQAMAAQQATQEIATQGGIAAVKEQA